MTGPSGRSQSEPWAPLPLPALTLGDRGHGGEAIGTAVC